MPFHLSKLAEGVLNALVPKSEEIVEQYLERLMAVPAIRKLFEWNPDVSVGVLSAFLRSFPEGKSPFNKALRDLAESLPREIKRTLEGKPGKPKEKKEKKQRKEEDVADGSSQSILSIFDQRLQGKIQGFAEWFFSPELTDGERKKVEEHILAMKPERIVLFLELDPTQRKNLIGYLKEAPAEPEVVQPEKPPPRENKVLKDLSNVFARAGSELEKKLPQKKEKKEKKSWLRRQ